MWNGSTQNFAKIMNSKNVETELKETFNLIESSTREVKRLVKHFFTNEQISNKNISTFFSNNFYAFLNFSLNISHKYPSNPISNVSITSMKLIFNFQRFHPIPVILFFHLFILHLFIFYFIYLLYLYLLFIYFLIFFIFIYLVCTTSFCLFSFLF